MVFTSRGSQKMLLFRHSLWKVQGSWFPPSACKKSLSASPFSSFPQIISSTYSLPVWFPVSTDLCMWLQESWAKMEIFYEQGLQDQSFYKACRGSLSFLLASVLGRLRSNAISFSPCASPKRKLLPPRAGCEVNHLYPNVLSESCYNGAPREFGDQQYLGGF